MLAVREKAELICKRRGKKFSKLQSVAFSKLIPNATADLTALLPAEANVFYIIKMINVCVIVAQATAASRLRCTTLGGAGIDAGNMELVTDLTVNTVRQYFDIETDSMLWFKNGATAGTILVSGEVWKVTYKNVGDD